MEVDSKSVADSGTEYGDEQPQVPPASSAKPKKTTLKVTPADGVNGTETDNVSTPSSALKARKTSLKGTSAPAPQGSAPSSVSEEKVRKKYRDYKRRLEALEQENLEIVTRLTYLRQTARKLLLERSFIFEKLEEFQSRGVSVSLKDISLVRLDSGIGEGTSDDWVSALLDTASEETVPISDIITQFVQASSVSGMGPFSAAKKPEKVVRRRSSKNDEAGPKKSTKDGSASRATASASSRGAKKVPVKQETDDSTKADSPPVTAASPDAKDEVTPTEPQPADDLDSTVDVSNAETGGGSKLLDEETEPGTKKRKKTKKRQVDPNLPKRPNNAFLDFCNDVRESVKEEMRVSGANVNQQPGDITKLLAEKWRSLEPDSKVFYQDKAETALRKWQLQVSELKASGVIGSSPNRPPSSTSGTPPAVKPEDDGTFSSSSISESEPSAAVPAVFSVAPITNGATVPVAEPVGPVVEIGINNLPQPRPAHFVPSVCRIHDFISAPAPAIGSDGTLPTPTLVIKPASNAGGVFNPHNLVAVSAANIVPGVERDEAVVSSLHAGASPGNGGLLNLANAAIMDDEKRDMAEEFSAPSDDDGDSGPPDVNNGDVDSSVNSDDVIDMET